MQFFLWQMHCTLTRLIFRAQYLNRHTHVHAHTHTYSQQTSCFSPAEWQHDYCMLSFHYSTALLRKRREHKWKVTRKRKRRRRRKGCLCSHMMLKARDCFQNNGGICLFCVQNKERQMRQRALQVRVDNDKEKAENRKTEQDNLREEQYLSQITSRADIMVRKVWYELKRNCIGWHLNLSEFATKQNSLIISLHVSPQSLSYLWPQIRICTPNKEKKRSGDIVHDQKRHCISIIWNPVLNER